MSVREKPNQRLLSLFHEQSCWMIEPLAAEMKYSIPSVRRFLAEVGYFSSFTHNGSWYTLQSIPRFDRDGLWFFRDIGFSRSGSFTRTLIDLAARSPAGMTAETLGAKLRVRCHSVLVQLCRNGRLQRQKMARSHVYFCVDPSIAAVQKGEKGTHLFFSRWVTPTTGRVPGTSMISNVPGPPPGTRPEPEDLRMFLATCESLH